MSFEKKEIIVMSIELKNGQVDTLIVCEGDDPL